MKKIIVIILFLFFLPEIGYSMACMHSHKVKVTKNELPCIELPTNNCGYVQFKNSCKKDVYYTNLECQEDKRFSYYQKDGFKILNNEVSLSREFFSGPIIMDTESSVYDYNRRINYHGGAWLPCKIKESNFNSENKLMTVQFRMDNKIYEITSQLPTEENNLLHLKGYILIAYMIIWILIIAFIITLIMGIIELLIYNRKIKKIQSNHSIDEKIKEKLLKKQKHAKNLIKTGVLAIAILIVLSIIAKYINTNIIY